MSAQRRMVPPRRLLLREKIVYRNDRGDTLGIYVTAGFDPETHALVEVFARPRGNVDSDLCRQMDDVGVLLSRLLQMGDTIGHICDGMGRLPGEPARAHSPIGAVADAARALMWATENEWPSPGKRRAYGEREERSPAAGPSQQQG